jgi:hypothetical protein
MVEKTEVLRALMTNIEKDTVKCEAGNKAAGKRIRAELSKMAKFCKEYRQAILEKQND